MKTITFAAAALVASVTIAHAGTVQIISSFGMPQISGNLDVVESMPAPGRGNYDVTNNTNGSLLGFGVSNDDTLPILQEGSSFGNFGCALDNTGFQVCYGARTLTAANWMTEELFDDNAGLVTFQDVFGDFADVAGGDNTINWFDAVDGDVQDGRTVDNFFGFIGAQPLSSIIGWSANGNGSAFFGAGQATVPGGGGGGGNPSTVPLPAAGWMLVAGLGGLGIIRRRRKA